MRQTAPPSFEPPAEPQSPSSVPWLLEIEKTVSLIPEVFRGSEPLNAYAPPPADEARPGIPLAADALTNPEHIKFGLRGCLAASLCYAIYSVLDWPGISTSVTTCLLTALSTVGASRQKQILRFAGALVGGVVIGMGAQIFILPSMDSIGEFTVLFIAVATLSAWFATSSSRLSYFGVQIFVAFCLINLLEFSIQTSLAVARDRVVGILLGLFVMWLAFDQFWSVPAGVEMKKAFISGVRLLAQLAREPVSQDIPLAIERSHVLRENINAQFGKVRSLADGVLLEFGETRRSDLLLRDRIRRWQPQLQTMFLLRIASLKYRLQLPGFELPEPLLHAQEQFDDRSARMLEGIADRIEGKAQPAELMSKDHFELPEEPQLLASPQIRSFFALLYKLDGLTTALAEEIEKEA
jgi:multidrug resistance protein MdtO